ncbi:MFS transporter [Candidatus Pantoea multigeneris]|uniref:MFS transporter n=1 Tax=Candidatus Pantoea multigeneris TaxID=2608357 RepID=A0ABX0R9Q8_9GAMM|nr:MFS transporter [Pantoea multigeneris]NIF20424.1 MFS transporter [Pantoea multigeneris]
MKGQTALPPKTASSTAMFSSAWLVTAVFMLSNSPTPLYVHWQAQSGFSTGTLTIIFALYIAGLLGTLLIAGQLSDRFGRRPVLLPGLSLALLACLLFATAHSVLALAVARLLTGVSVGVMVSAGMAAVSDFASSDRRRQAALLASVSMVLGAGLGPLLAGGVAQASAAPILPVFITEFIVLTSALVIALRLPYSPPTVERTQRLRLRLPSVPLANRRHLACGIATFGPGITATSFVLALGPSLLSHLLNVQSPMIAGGMACAMFLTATGVQFALRHWHIRHLFLASVSSTVLAMASLEAAVQFSFAPLLVLAALLAGAGQGLGQLGGLTLIGLHVPDNRRAEANAVMNIGGYIPAGLLPVAAGFLIDALGLASGATIFAAALAIAAILGGLFVNRTLAALFPAINAHSAPIVQEND